MRSFAPALAGAAVAAGAVVAGAASSGQAAAMVAAPVPLIEQLVVLSSGDASYTRVRARRTTVRVRGSRCRVAGGTPLAALVRAPLRRLRLRDDFGSCPASAAGVYVRAIGPDAERVARGSGWVYKVGSKAASAGAGNPTGPFGRGRLRRGQRVLWFYCRQAGNCQRTLAVEPSAGPAGEVGVRVTGYDDNGRGVAVEGATVEIGPMELTTDVQGRASATLEAGSYRVTATKPGLVRSFRETVVVK